LANLKLGMMAAFGKLKRGSVQVQRAAIKASGKLDTIVFHFYEKCLLLEKIHQLSFWTVPVFNIAKWKSVILLRFIVT
jgi:hypothetical protein